MAKCPAVNDGQRSSHWSYRNWNCGGSTSPEYCNPNEVQITVNKSPGCAWNGCTSCSDKTQYVCSPPYDITTNSLWDCCSGAKSAYNCDPSYCVDSNSCNQFLQTSCTGDILTNKDHPRYITCKTWAQKNQSKYNAILASYCDNPDRLSNSVCRQFGLEVGGIDNSVSQYCDTHPNDSYCSCQYPLTSYKGSDPQLQILNNPICYGDKCPINGYKSANQRTFKCPSSLSICNNSISTAGQTTTYLSSLANTCSTSNTSASNTAGSNASGSTTTATAPATTTTAGFSISGLSPIKQLLLLIVIVILSAGGMYVLKNKNNNQSTNQPVSY